MAGILEEKDLVKDDQSGSLPIGTQYSDVDVARAKYVFFKVKKTVTLFCGLTYKDLGIFFPKSLELKEVLPKINKYLEWQKIMKK